MLSKQGKKFKILAQILLVVSYSIIMSQDTWLKLFVNISIIKEHNLLLNINGGQTDVAGF